MSKGTVPRHCKHCGKEFNACPSEIRKNRAIYCCQSCRIYDYHQRRVTKCQTCGSEFLRKSLKHRFCSRPCFVIAAKEGRVHKYTQWVDRYGYLMQGSVGKTTPVHRLVVERVLGIKLKSHVIVHHINGNKQDNSPGNLMICTQSYHRMLQDRMANLYMEEHFSEN